MPLGSSAVTLALFIVAVIVIIKTIRIVPQQHALVIERFGRFHAVLAPGLNFVLPFVDRVAYQHDLREIPFDVPSQICITKDNTQLQVDGILYFQVTDPRLASYGSSNFKVAITQLAQTTLRSVLGQHSLDELLSERDKINAILQQIIDEATSPWGIKVSIVEVKDVEIPGGMQRAMARQAEAERERRAKVIAAEGEFQASERLKDAAQVLSENPMSLQLRFLQTMLEISSERSSTIILPLPIELFRPLIESSQGYGQKS